MACEVVKESTVDKHLASEHGLGRHCRSHLSQRAARGGGLSQLVERVAVLLPKMLEGFPLQDSGHLFWPRWRLICPQCMNPAPRAPKLIPNLRPLDEVAQR